MKKAKLNLNSEVLLKLNAGEHEVVTDGAKVFVLMHEINEDGGEAAPASPAPRGGKKDEVVDDTKAVATAKPKATAKPVAPKAAAPAARTRAVAPPAPVAEEDDLIPIEEENWGGLNTGDMVLAQLNMEGADGEKLWEAEVVGWKVPKGSKEEVLYVKFLEDGAEDYLREGDKLFEYRVSNS